MNPLSKRPARLLLTGLLVFAVLCPSEVRATEPFVKVLTVGGDVLEFPRGVRNIGLGAIGAADPASPDNIYYNPAIGFLVDGLHVTTGHYEWGAEIHFRDYGAFYGKAFSIRPGLDLRVGGGVRYADLKFETSSDLTIFVPEGTGRTLSKRDYYTAFTVGCGLSIGRFDIGLGISAKPTTMEIADSKTDLSAYDVGVLAQARFEFDSGMRIVPSFGISRLNLGSNASWNDYRMKLPEQFRAGFGLRFESQSSSAVRDRIGNDRPIVAVSGVVEYVERRDLDEKEGAGLGIETSILDVLSVRLSHTDNTLVGEGQAYGFGIGWQFRMVRLRIDYASIPGIAFFGESDYDAWGGTVIY